MLKLQFSPKKVLPIERPDGRIVQLQIKRITLKDASDAEEQRREAEKKWQAGEIRLDEYLFKSWQNLVEKFDPKDFLDLEPDHLKQIGEALRKIQAGESRTEEEKKTE